MTAGYDHTVRPVIVGWSSVSPFGIGRQSFRDGLLAGTPVAAAPDPRQWSVPDERVCVVPGFEQRAVLGNKGTRSMDRVSGLAVSTVGKLLAEAGAAAPVPTGERTGLVLATTTGSAQSMMTFTGESLTGEQPYHVDPARMPNVVMNCAAGLCAIWHKLKGPNTTLAGGRTGGLFALNYARRLFVSGRADLVICGGAEEFSEARSWLEWHTRDADTAGAVLGEGCAMLLLEPAGAHERPPLAEVLATEFRVCVEGDVGGTIAAALRSALRRIDATPGELWAMSTSGAPGLAGQRERTALTELVGAEPLARAAALGLIGDTGAASASFGVVALLALADDTDRLVAASSVDRDGTVGVAVLRLLGGAR